MHLQNQKPNCKVLGPNPNMAVPVTSPKQKGSDQYMEGLLLGKGRPKFSTPQGSPNNMGWGSLYLFLPDSAPKRQLPLTRSSSSHGTKQPVPSQRLPPPSRDDCQIKEACFATVFLPSDIHLHPHPQDTMQFDSQSACLSTLRVSSSMVSLVPSLVLTKH